MNGLLRHALGSVGRALFLVALAVGSASASASKPAGDVAVDRQVLILTRALAYDGNLKTRAGAEIVIGVLAKGGNPGSEQAAEAISTAFKALGTVKVQGLPLKAIALTFTTSLALSNTITGQNVDAIYVCTGLEGELDAILQVTRQRKVISIASKEDQVNRGASLGVFAVEGKPTIFVNLPSSKLESTAFGSDLLRLAKVIK